MANILHQILCQTPKRLLKIAWVSTSDGGISFGLNDRTYIVPRFKSRTQIGIWNMYNRVALEFQAPSNPTGLQPVENPHFTFHPPARFHLKGHDDHSHKDQDLWACDFYLGMVANPDDTVPIPWIRATTAPLHQLNPAKSRTTPTDELTMTVASEDVSIRIAVDFVKLAAIPAVSPRDEWYFHGASAIVRVRVSTTSPTIANLAWFLEY
jgi:hypothetical protein